MFTKEECKAFTKVVEENPVIAEPVDRMNDMLCDVMGILEMANMMEPPMINTEEGKNLANLISATRGALYLLKDISEFTYL